MTNGVLVRVPASSANLGPGFDSFAAALALHLEVEVREADHFGVHTELAVPHGRENLCVRAFEHLHPADNLTFTMRSNIALAGGLGSSAAAIVAGLTAANSLFGLDAHLFSIASGIEGHPDNVAAALHGGFVVCADGRATPLEVPAGLAAVAVVPSDAAAWHASGRSRVSTSIARAALPDEVPIADAVFNIAHGALLVLGLSRGDWELVERGLADRVHQDRRGSLYPNSHALIARASEFGALGATISGAGPTVLVWCLDETAASVAERLRGEVENWAKVMRVAFEADGAQVHELASPAT